MDHSRGRCKIDFSQGPGLRRHTLAIVVIFGVIGASWGVWYTRFPTIRDTLNLSLTQMSIYVLLPSIGTILGLATASYFVTKFGERAMILAGILFMGLTLPVATLMIFAGQHTLSYALLIIYGIGFGFSDVATNISGSIAERATGSSRMMLMHAGFSVGGISSVLFGAWAERVQLSLFVHQLGFFIVFIVVTALLYRFIPPKSGVLVTTSPITITGAPARKPRVWSNPFVLLLGFIGLAGSVADGVATDWLPLAFIDVYGLTSGMAVFMLALVFVGELLTRLLGDRLVSRLGKRRVLLFTLASACIGVLLVALAPTAWIAGVGAFLWGFGAGLAFPISVSAAAKNPKTATRNVSAVSTIGYSAYVLGPAGFGLLGDHFGFRVTFAVLAVILLLAWLSSRAVKDDA